MLMQTLLSTFWSFSQPCNSFHGLEHISHAYLHVLTCKVPKNAAHIARVFPPLSFRVLFCTGCFLMLSALHMHPFLCSLKRGGILFYNTINIYMYPSLSIYLSLCQFIIYHIYLSLSTFYYLSTFYVTFNKIINYTTSIFFLTIIYLSKVFKYIKR